MTGQIPSIDLDTLNRLADVESLDIADDLETIGDRLDTALEGYAEFELRSDGRRIDLVTLEKSPSVVSDFVAVLEGREIAAEDIERLSGLGRFGAGATLGMKLPVAGSLDSGELYVRTVLPLAEGRGYLERRSVDKTALGKIERVADVLDKGHTHMLAADAGESSPHFTCLFTTWLTEESDDERIREVLGVLELPSTAVDQTMELHSLLGANRPMTVYISVPVPSDRQPTRLKLDYPDVRLGLAAEVTAIVESEAAATRLLQGGDILDASTTSYTGVVVGPGGPEGSRTYFTRHSSRSG